MGVAGLQFSHATESLRAKTMSLRIEETSSNDKQLRQNKGAALTRTTSPAKRQRVSKQATSMFDKCSNKEHTAIDPNNEQLDTLKLRVGLEHSAYLDYKVSESEIKKVVSAVEETLLNNRNHKRQNSRCSCGGNCLGFIYSQGLLVLPGQHCVYWHQVHNQRTISLMQATH
jgi:hypothetical protein